MSGFSGMQAWLLQRFSAVYIAIFSIMLTLMVWGGEELSYRSWVALFAQPWLQVMSSLFVIALLLHAWIGLRDVILDYIKPVGIKMLVMTAIVLVLLASGFWFLRALLLFEVIS